MLSTFVTIPDHPAYQINAKGQVRMAKGGYIISHDYQGCVRLKTGVRKSALFYIGELFAQVAEQGVFPAPDPEQVKKLEELQGGLVAAQRANEQLVKLLEKYKQTAVPI